MVRVWKVYGEPKPAESPFPNPVWPLWFAPHSFLVTRRAGGLLILGMIVGAIVGW
jgi:1,4-dihydroxy-2-naphthoate octaprenyltransferase